MLKWTLALMLAACACTTEAQTAPATNKTAETKTFYQLTFVVRELEGDRVVNTRTYYASARTNDLPSSIRAGEKIPFASGEGTVTQWQQIEVGVSVDARDLQLVGDQLSLRVLAEVTSIAPPRDDRNMRQPLIRNNKWDGMVAVPIRRPTTIFSSDDPFSTQKIQLQLTATPLP